MNIRRKDNKMRIIAALCAVTISFVFNHITGSGVVAAADAVALSIPPVIQGTVGGQLGKGGPAVAVDSSGNRYVIGSFSGSRDFNPFTGEDTKSSIGGSVDAFVTRFNKDGSYAWTQTFGGTGADVATAVVVSADDSIVYVAGSFNSTNAQIGGSGSSVSTSGGVDAFVIALAASTGAPRNAFGPFSNGIQKCGGTGNDNAVGMAISNGYLYIVGDFDSPNAKIGGTGTAIASSGGTDALLFSLDAGTGLAKSGFGLSSTGMTSFGSSGTDLGFGVVATASIVYYCGSYSGTSASIPSTTSMVSNSGGTDAFVIALGASNGSPFMMFGPLLNGIQTFGGSGNEVARALATDGTKLYVGGSFSSLNALVGGGSFASTVVGGDDAFVLALNATSGTAVTAFGTTNNGVQTFGGMGDEKCNGLALKGTTLIVVGDFTSATVQIGASGPMFSPDSVNSSGDAFVLKLNTADGSPDTSFGQLSSGIQSFGGTSADSAKSIAWFGTTLYVAGVCASTNAGLGSQGMIDATGFGGFLLPLNESDGTAVIPVITSPLLRGAATGFPFSYKITATDFPTVFTASGLPSTLSLVGDTISGTAPAVGTYLIGLKAKNGVGEGADQLELRVINQQTAVSNPPIIQGIIPNFSGQALCIDSAGNRYVCGSFVGDVDFNPGSGADVHCNVGSNPGNTDAFVTRYNADGSYAWTQTFGGTGNEAAHAVTVSPDGQTVYVVGVFDSSAAQIDSAGPALSSLGSSDVFVLALNASNGTAKQGFGHMNGGLLAFGGTSVEIGNGIAATATSVFVSGSFQSSNVTFSNVTTSVSAAAGGSDAFVISMNAATGVPDFSFGPSGTGIQTFGGTGNEDGNGIIVAGAVLYVAGSFDSSDAQFGAAGGTIASNGGKDAFVLALNVADGTPLSTFGPTLKGVQKFGGSGTDLATALAFNNSTLYFTGTFSGSNALVGGASVSVASTGTNNAFVIALDATTGAAKTSFGVPNSGAQILTGPGSITGNSLAVNASALFVTGSFGSTLQVGGTGPTVSTIASSRDGFVASLDASSGSARTGFGLSSSGIQTTGGSGSDSALSAALNGSALYVAGSSASTNLGVGGVGSFDSTGFNGFLIPLDTTRGQFNLAPTDVALSPSSIFENNAVGDVVGSFSTTDPNPGDTFTYTFVTGTGGTDNASFTISGATLKANAVFVFATKSSYSIRVRTTDQGGLFFEKALTITIKPTPNSAPTDIALSLSSIQEKNAIGATIGVLSSTDPDAGNTFTYTLVTGAGSTDNGSFTLSGATLKANVVFVSATKSSYSIRIRTTDQGGLFFEKVFAITITPTPNAAPTDIALNPASIQEGNAVGATVGTLSTTDPDAGNTFTYSFVTGSGSTDNASFTISGATLKASAVFAFASKSSYSIRVRTTDQGGLFFEKALTVTILQQPNSAPTDITLSNSTFPDTLTLGGKIGSLTTSDPDIGNTFTYSLVTGSGGDDNALFAINADVLTTAAALNFNVKNAFTVRIRSTDAGGLFVEKSFALNLTTQPNSGASGVPNVSNTIEGVDTVTNPVDGLTITVANSDGGLIQLAVDVNSLRSRAGINLITEFSDIPGRSSQVSGPLPAHKFGTRGIFIAKSTATDSLTGASLGKGRKTLVISAKETGEVVGASRAARGAPRLLGDPPSNAITTRMIKGKFVFGAGKSDAVSFGGTIQLPPKLDPKLAHEFSIAIGNIVVDTSVDAKGNATALSNTGVLKSLKIVYKVKKGKLAEGGELATISAVLSAKGLVEAGFDTEGISNKSKDVLPGKSGQRSIQLGMLLDGIPYESTAPVTFSISKDSEFANIQSRN